MLGGALGLALLGLTAQASEIVVVGTEVLGPFTGPGALLAESQRDKSIAYFGTDLGWSYVHGDQLQFLFGDTWSTADGQGIDPLNNDAFGHIELAATDAGKAIVPGRLPELLLATGTDGRLAGLDPGVPLESLKTPLGGFSDGAHEFALFITGKPQACKADADCGTELSCDTPSYYVGAPPDIEQGLTLACEAGTPACRAAPGLCVDRGSSVWSANPPGRAAATSMRHLLGIRDTRDPARYADIWPWQTTRFINSAVRSVAGFDVERRDARPDPAKKIDRVFFWGRPGFIGIGARQRELSLYFAYADIPPSPDSPWTLHYFTGADKRGRPQFSSRESLAVPLDLDASKPGVQPREVHDIVHQMSIAWIPALERWVMLYGGGINTVPLAIAPRGGLLEIFTRSECELVSIGNGAIRLRTAAYPWGPWSPPQDVFVGGRTQTHPLEEQYAAGGVLYHPDCTQSGCVAGSADGAPGGHGWLYGSNLIEPWTRETPTGVEIIWNASTWNPYRVILLKTRLERR